MVKYICIWEDGLEGDLPSSIACASYEEALELTTVINDDCGAKAKIYQLSEVS
ncbi:MAG TPA: hypothetical protein PKA10_13980 [Selenomonadales bacterium]|nr:hypothetical protein [Selenomonadales bacterium]